METIRNNKNEISHIIFRYIDFAGRKNLLEYTEPLQVCSLDLRRNEKFTPHVHLAKTLESLQSSTQEAWVIIEGSVCASLFDSLGNFLSSHHLGKGDCVITLRGGHSYEALDDAKVYEFKTGPYLGVEKDKRIIGSF